MADREPTGLHCAVHHQSGGLVQLAHGGGGRAMANLIDELFAKAFANPLLDARHDGAVFDPGGKVAFTTDSYVVQPLVFPGGDIGTLAVNGTVNDLAMCGARPLHLSAGFIIEDGLPMATLEPIVTSMGRAPAAAGVTIVTGDTKVVERGQATSLSSAAILAVTVSPSWLREKISASIRSTSPMRAASLPSSPKRTPDVPWRSSGIKR